MQVALARYLRNLQREEIRTELLREHGIVVSDGSITNLCDRFLTLLERLHRRRAPALRAAMSGGYPLHIDATSEHGKGGLFVCLDGWRGWVLHAQKISSQNANVAEHFFGADKQKLRRRLGRANLGGDLEDQPAQTALASNLLHGDYVRVLCGSLEHLRAAFAELDQEKRRHCSAATEIPGC